jgi:transposase
MEAMNKSNKFSPEVRERSERMVQEHRGQSPSLWSVVESIAPKIGCVPQTLLTWFNRRRLLEPIGYIPPAEAEANYYRLLASQAADVVA